MSKDIFPMGDRFVFLWLFASDNAGSLFLSHAVPFALEPFAPRGALFSGAAARHAARPARIPHDSSSLFQYPHCFFASSQSLSHVWVNHAIQIVHLRPVWFSQAGASLHVRHGLFMIFMPFRTRYTQRRSAA